MIWCGLVKTILDLRFFTHMQPRAGWYVRVHGDDRNIVTGLGLRTCERRRNLSCIKCLIADKTYLNNLVSGSPTGNGTCLPSISNVTSHPPHKLTLQFILRDSKLALLLSERFSDPSQAVAEDTFHVPFLCPVLTYTYYLVLVGNLHTCFLIRLWASGDPKSFPYLWALNI